MLNEAYKVLMREDPMKGHDSQVRAPFRMHDSTTSHYSSWNGPLRPQALFVDEKGCIGYDPSRFTH